MYRFILILIVCHVQTAIAAEIIKFTATIFNKSTATNDSIFLMVEVANCSSPCSCLIQKNKTGISTPVKFSPSTNATTTGSVTLENLQPYTVYSLEMNCSQVTNIGTLVVRTDVFRPSPPRDFEVQLNGHHLELKWKPPSIPHGPINDYRVTIDGIEIKPPLNNNALFYRMDKNYILGTTNKISIIACNIDTQERILCSNSKGSETSYFNTNNSTNPNISATKSSLTNSIMLNTLPNGSVLIQQISLVTILLMKLLVIIY
ncbi:unnamed protein product [Rotaria socialis]|uniref:Fibronectin type-III domain-containing protein n=1 Tax=Rotaria socialis TaxID=392032 RepID=A0A818X8Q5_9BILA|nr:unnamed protein product [Rotaria socialis]CAF3321842.1 unnamed protein product [Rotaria socialis]CAF3345985.1 unnamed protein product [Rotaria socialis]CAF3736788.1 unnamed protein product [Rotaria socialis]CAF4211340.1 unnamed protein product [Rotaria socialis]